MKSVQLADATGKRVMVERTGLHQVVDENLEQNVMRERDVLMTLGLEFHMELTMGMHLDQGCATRAASSVSARRLWAAI